MPIAEIYTINQLSDSSHCVYDRRYTIGTHSIEYIENVERGQGGPSTGVLVIDGTPIEEHRFGGPPLLSASNMLAPVVEWPSGFRLARIDLKTLEVITFGEREVLILLKEVRDGEAYYTTNLRLVNWIPLDDNIGEFKRVAIQ